MTWKPVLPDERAVQTLDSGLGLVRRGCKKDFVSSLIERSGDGLQDAARLKVADSLQRSMSMIELPAHLAAEERSKAGHGSYSYRPSFFTMDDRGVSMESQVRRNFAHHPCDMSDGDALDYADAAVRALYNPTEGLLNPCSLRVAEESFLGKTGLGWPVFSSDRTRLAEVRALSAGIITADFPHESIYFYPAVVGFRGQPRGLGKFCKSRAIFQCSRVIGNLEKMIQIPLFKVLRRNAVFAAWAEDPETAVNLAVTRLMRSSRHPLVSVDFSNFDASIPPEVIRRVFSLICEWFNRRWHPMIVYLSGVFNGCGIIIPHPTKKREIISGEGRKGGVPSGSVLTNLIDSLVNLWVVHYAAARDRGRVTHALVQGDDGVYSFVGTNHDKISRRLSSDFGMVLSVEKSLVSSKEVQFLQNCHHVGFHVDGVLVGVRPLMRVLNGMMSYEDVNKKWDDQEMYDAVRWLQQLQNAHFHPDFRNACKWLFDRAPGIPRFITAVLRGDVTLLQNVRAALSRKYEWNKVAVEGLGQTEVFQTMCQLSHVKA